MSTKTDEGSKIYLAGPQDWDGWNREFQRLAIDSRIWDKIDPDQDDPVPFLTEPIAPDLNTFIAQRAPTSVSTRSSSSTTSTQETPVSSDQTRLFTILWNVYTDQERKFNREIDAIKALKSWVTTSVPDHIRRTSCKPTEDLRTWYKALNNHCAVDQGALDDRIRQQYRRAVIPISDPRTAETWLKAWEQAVSRAEERDMPEGTNTSLWLSDFIDAVRPAFQVWAMVYKREYQGTARKTELTHAKLANDLRNEIQSTALAQGKTKVVRGAFGPSYNARLPPERDDEGSFLDTAGKGDAHPADGSFARGSLKRSNPPNRNLNSSLCQACHNKGHSIQNCFYVYPEKAFKKWRLRPDVQERVNQALQDPEIQELLQPSIKRSRTTSSTPLRAIPSRSASSSNSLQPPIQPLED